MKNNIGNMYLRAYRITQICDKVLTEQDAEYISRLIIKDIDRQVNQQKNNE